MGMKTSTEPTITHTRKIEPFRTFHLCLHLVREHERVRFFRKSDPQNRMLRPQVTKSSFTWRHVPALLSDSSTVQPKPVELLRPALSSGRLARSLQLPAPI
jgi:hypothetical protein